MALIKIWCETCRQIVAITDWETEKQNRQDKAGRWVECDTETIHLSCGHRLEREGDPDNGGWL